MRWFNFHNNPLVIDVIPVWGRRKLSFSRSSRSHGQHGQSPNVSASRSHPLTFLNFCLSINESTLFLWPPMYKFLKGRDRKTLKEVEKSELMLQPQDHQTWYRVWGDLTCTHYCLTGVWFYEMTPQIHWIRQWQSLSQVWDARLSPLMPFGLDPVHSRKSPSIVLLSLFSIWHLVIMPHWLSFPLFVSYFSKKIINVLRAGMVQCLCFSWSS